MLKLRRGVVVSADPLEVEVAGERRRAWADPELIGEVNEGDEVVVNVEALDLGLGSGGFDIVHVNLTSGLQGEGSRDQHVMKLNYSPLQHPVAPVEEQAGSRSPAPSGSEERDEAADALQPDRPGQSGGLSAVAVIPLHGYLAPIAWAAAQGATDFERPLRIGFIQSFGGALPGSMSKVVGELRERDLLCGHITAGPAYGGEHEAISVLGAIDAAAGLGWDAAVIGPGPGILGSATRFGHGGTSVLDNAHAALALGIETLIAPRMSSGDERPRHRGLSHHTATVLEHLLVPALVAEPEIDEAGGTDAAEAHADLREACKGRHRIQPEAADLNGYLASGLPAKTMGRGLQQDELFFSAALASGAALARVVSRAWEDQGDEADR